MGTALLLEVQLNPEQHNYPPAHPSERKDSLLIPLIICTMCTNYYIFICSI